MDWLPYDVEGECNAHLLIGDDYGDSHATIRCQLPKGHHGMHVQEFMRCNKPVVITWYVDERENEGGG